MKPNKRGYEARMAGAKPSDNPYTKVGMRAAWNDGWAVADQELADAECAAAVQRIQEPVHVVERHAPPPAADFPTHWQKATNLKDHACPGCGASRCSQEGITHRPALACNRSGRDVAYVSCRECGWQTKMPVRR